MNHLRCFGGASPWGTSYYFKVIPCKSFFGYDGTNSSTSALASRYAFAFVTAANCLWILLDAFSGKSVIHSAQQRLQLPERPVLQFLDRADQLYLAVSYSPFHDAFVMRCHSIMNTRLKLIKKLVKICFKKATIFRYLFSNGHISVFFMYFLNYTFIAYPLADFCVFTKPIAYTKIICYIVSMFHDIT